MRTKLHPVTVSVEEEPWPGLGAGLGLDLEGIAAAVPSSWRAKDRPYKKRSGTPSRQCLRLAVLCLLLLTTTHILRHFSPCCFDLATGCASDPHLDSGEVISTPEHWIASAWTTPAFLSMVSAMKGLAARAGLMAPAHLVQRDGSTYVNNTAAAATTLQGWYQASQGLWDTTGWWNGANCLTVLADFACLEPGEAQTLGIADVISSTFTNAQLASASKRNTRSLSGPLAGPAYVTKRAAEGGAVAERGYAGFLDDYYDDEGWWALGLIRSWDFVQDADYLSMAEDIFEDMKNGTDSTCGGGIWWSKDRTYKNAIANELYLSVAASLANRVSDKKQYYLDLAEQEWAWFKGSGLINANNNINDGLTIQDDGSCVNNDETEWSYNQGVILGGLAELAKASGNSSYLSEAATLATAALSLLSDSNGIIHDTACEPDCGSDGSQFKGIFVRNLGYLDAAAPQDAYRESILGNADSIWATDRNTENNQLGVVWSGPYDAGGDPTAASQSSAMDALVAAVRVM